MNDTDVRFRLLHTYMKSVWSLRCFQHKWGHKYTNNIPRTARRVTSWAFDRFIWVKRSSYHIYIGYRNLKGSHGNLSKYKFGLAEYITVYVIQLCIISCLHWMQLKLELFSCKTMCLHATVSVHVVVTSLPAPQAIKGSAPITGRSISASLLLLSNDALNWPKWQ